MTIPSTGIGRPRREPLGVLDVLLIGLIFLPLFLLFPLAIAGMAILSPLALRSRL